MISFPLRIPNKRSVIYRIGSRVVNCCVTGCVPFGATGTIVRFFYARDAEVIYDQPFIGATRLGGRLRTDRGAVQRLHYLLPLNSSQQPTRENVCDRVIDEFFESRYTPAQNAQQAPATQTYYNANATNFYPPQRSTPSTNQELSDALLKLKAAAAGTGTPGSLGKSGAEFGTPAQAAYSPSTVSPTPLGESPPYNKKSGNSVGSLLSAAPGSKQGSDLLQKFLSNNQPQQQHKPVASGGGGVHVSTLLANATSSPHTAAAAATSTNSTSANNISNTNNNRNNNTNGASAIPLTFLTGETQLTCRNFLSTCQADMMKEAERLLSEA